MQRTIVFRKTNCASSFCPLKHMKAINKYRLIEHQCNGGEKRTSVMPNNDARLREKETSYTLARKALNFLWHDDTPVKQFSVSALISLWPECPQRALSVNQSVGIVCRWPIKAAIVGFRPIYICSAHQRTSVAN